MVPLRGRDLHGNNLNLGLDEQHVDAVEVSYGENPYAIRYTGRHVNFILDPRIPAIYLLDRADDPSFGGRQIGNDQLVMQDPQLYRELYDDREDMLHPFPKRRASENANGDLPFSYGLIPEPVIGVAAASSSFNHPIPNATQNGVYSHFGGNLEMNGPYFNTGVVGNHTNENNFGPNTGLWNSNNSQGPRSELPISNSSSSTRPLHPSLGFASFSSNALDGRDAGFRSIGQSSGQVSHQFEWGSPSGVAMNMDLMTNIPNVSPWTAYPDPYSFGGQHGGRMADGVSTYSNPDVRQIQYAASLSPYLNHMAYYYERVVEEVVGNANFNAPFPSARQLEAWGSAETPASETFEVSSQTESEPNDYEMGPEFEIAPEIDGSTVHDLSEDSDSTIEMLHDVDDMIYEALIALGEEAENWKFGLSKEAIVKHLKLGKYIAADVDPAAFNCQLCCICQEDYVDGEDLGKLDCGHHFHANCIKQWLEEKNSCPICQRTALAAAEEFY